MTTHELIEAHAIVLALEAEQIATRIASNPLLEAEIRRRAHALTEIAKGLSEAVERASRTA